MKRIAFLCFFLFLIFGANAQVAPNFIITDTDGVEHNLYEDHLDKGKIVVIKMFFVACPICKPYNVPMQNLYEEFGAGQDSVEFFLLTTKSWDSNAEIADYKLQYGITFPASGNDGGGFAATAPYRNGDFGVFFGAPSFIIIEPDRTVHFDVGGGGVSGTIESITNKLNEIQGGGNDNAASTNVTVNVNSYKGDELPEFSIRLRSADDHNNSYIVPNSFTYPSEAYPEVSNPEILIETSGTINNDGITTFDLFTIQRHILQFESPDNIQILASDVNGSGSTSAADLLSIRKTILNIQDSFSINKSYFSVLSECNNDMSKCIESETIDTSLESQEINFTIAKYGDIR